MRVRNRVAIPVEPDIRRLPGDHGAHHVGLEGMRRQWEEPRLLLREDLRDGVIALLGMGSLVCHLITPPPKLRIEVIDVAKGSGGEEGVPQVLNLALDFAFFVPAAGGARARREVIVTRELQ